ncbi:putative LRR receptor-like serine/threonine-protein kinase [Planoprotostelium fungivorum]|uniref:Putative LRR receptor-like serine/threonine-protein kinase n=1 Tax=Planoprotostelium fungivorum TaxID=1890364 RepID=A0A2P6MNH5_9EUKA|nr:putative LRR receptor-like serine/threonine-protein kinase [Planoprotostelium fungivorum]
MFPPLIFNGMKGRRLLLITCALLFCIRESDAVGDVGLVPIMQEIWSSLKGISNRSMVVLFIVTGPSTRWLGNDVCNTTDYVGVYCDPTKSHPVVVSLNNGGLSGTIPSFISDLVNLTRLELGANSLSGSVPSSICSMSQMFYLNLYSNQLEGSIPPCISNLKALTNLYLNDNRLNGSIPSFASSLNIFVIHHNRLTGQLPSSLNNLNNLYFFDASFNLLSGSLPDLTNLSHLTSLIISNNSLSGVLPSSIMNLPSLTNLTLYGNRLNGTLPARLLSLPGLTSLNVSQNKLIGVEYVNVTVSCDVEGNLLSCLSHVRLPSVCRYSLLPCTVAEDIERLYTNSSLTTSEIESVLVAAVQQRDVQTTGVISAVVTALLRNSTAFEFNSVDVSLVLETFNVSATKEKIESGISGGAVAVSLPLSVFTSTRASVAVSSVAFNPFSSIQNDSIHVVGVSVYDERGREMDIRGSAEFINISMGTINDLPRGYEAVCQYWNESSSTWQRDGCRLLIEGNITVCQSNHLTNFSIGVQPGALDIIPVEKNLDHRMLIIIITSCVVGVVALCLVIVLSIVKYRRFSVKKTSFPHCEVEVKERMEWKERLSKSEKNEVWRVLQGEISTVVVKKRTDGDARSLAQEATKLKEMHHPNIVMFLGQNLSECWLMMEWMEDGSLFTFSQRHPVSPLLYSIGKDVAQGMAYVAEQNIVHTQLTPHHILLRVRDNTAVAKISGFSDGVQDKSEYRRSAGSHTAPEVVAERRQRKSSDVWSFGILLSFIASDGKPEETQQGTCGVKIDGRWETSVKAMIQECTTFDPICRPTFRDIAKQLTRRRNVESAREEEVAEPDHYGVQYFG